MHNSVKPEARDKVAQVLIPRSTCRKHLWEGGTHAWCQRRWGDNGDNESGRPHDAYYPLMRPPSRPPAAWPGVISASIHPADLSYVVFHRLLNPSEPGYQLLGVVMETK